MSDVIALVFDFDDTLAPDSTSGFLEHIGVDTASFWSTRVDPLLAAGWDPVPAYLYAMIELSRSGQYGTVTSRFCPIGVEPCRFTPGSKASFPV